MVQIPAQGKTATEDQSSSTCTTSKPPAMSITGATCLFISLRPRNGMTGCDKPAAKAALSNNYQLCQQHYTDNCKTNKRERIEEYKVDPSKASALLAILATSSTSSDTEERCQHEVIRSKRKELCGRARAKDSIYCYMHTAQEERKRARKP